jgi:hypothetical protein
MRQPAAPGEMVALGPVGIWHGTGPRPRVLGIPSKSDVCIGLRVSTGQVSNVSNVQRLPADPVTGKGEESIDEMILRAAEMHPDAGEFVLLYASS